MQTKNYPPSLELVLEYNDLEILREGNKVGTRWDTENKVYINPIYPYKENQRSFSESLKIQEYGKLDRSTMEIDLYIPHAVLDHAFIRASNFIQGINLEILPEPDTLKDLTIRLLYP